MPLTEKQRARRRARETTPEFREAHRAYEAKRWAEALAQWLVEHPGSTLADREFGTRMRQRKARRKRFGPQIGGRLTATCYIFDHPEDEL